MEYRATVQDMITTLLTDPRCQLPIEGHQAPADPLAHNREIFVILMTEHDINPDLREQIIFSDPAVLYESATKTWCAGVMVAELQSTIDGMQWIPEVMAIEGNHFQTYQAAKVHLDRFMES